MLLPLAAGHGDSINDIAVHPQRCSIILSCSKDLSIRMWNFQSKTCVAVFAGEWGHISEIITLDFHQTNANRFLSAGLDGMVKIWDFQDMEQEVISSYQHQDPKRAFKALFKEYPIFSSSLVSSCWRRSWLSCGVILVIKIMPAAANLENLVTLETGGLLSLHPMLLQQQLSTQCSI